MAENEHDDDVDSIS